MVRQETAWQEGRLVLGRTPIYVWIGMLGQNGGGHFKSGSRTEWSVLQGTTICSELGE